MARAVKLELDAKVTGLVNGLRTAQKATQDYARDVESWRKKHEQSLDTVGGAAGKFGIAMAAGLAFAGKAAIDWESAWAGVMKTNDGTSKQTQQLEQDLRNLTGVLPSTHTEIASVAEAAGQLGVGIDDVAGFSKVMLDLGETTNLSADEAATALARFSNIMGTSFSDADRLGSTIVGLGNNFATTEAEIVHMAQRIAPVGRIMNMTEADVLSMATAMSSVGIEAEAGGTAISMVMRKIDADVREGGEGLIGWADAAGSSADDFATAWRTRPAEAMQILAAGLGDTAAAGGDVNAILTDLGIKGIRESATMLSLASASDLLASSLEMGAEEWEKNTALMAEAEIRYQTTEAKISMAWNQIKDAAISAGGVLLPMIGSMAEAVANLASWFADLPAPVQTVLTMLGSIGAVSGLAIGGLIPLAKKFSELNVAMTNIYGTGGRATRAIQNMGKALGGIAIVGAGLIIGKATIEAINEAARKGQPTLEEYFNLLATGGTGAAVRELDFGGGGRAVDVYRKQNEELAGLSDEAVRAARAIEHLGKINSPVGWLESLNVGHLADATNEAQRLNDAMGGVARLFEMGEVSKGQEAFQSFAEQLRFTDEQVGQIINSVPELKSALTTLATENGIQLDPNDDLGLVDLALGRIKGSGSEAAAGLSATEEALADVGVSAAGAVSNMEDFLEVLFQTGLLTMNSRDAASAYEEQLDSVAEAAKEIAKGKMGKALEKDKKDFDLTTEAGRLANEEFQSVARKGMAEVEAMSKEGLGQDALQGKLNQTYTDLIKSGEAFGMSKTAATELAREILGVPSGVDIKSWMDEQAMLTATSTTRAIEGIPGYTEVTVAVSEDGTVGQVQSKINGVTGKEEFIFVTDDGTVVNVQSAIANIDGKDVPVWVTDDGTVVGTQEAINGIKGKDVTITATAATVEAERQLNHVARPRSASITMKATLTDIPTPTADKFVPRRATGGSIFGSGTETSDSILIRASHNEHMLSAKEVRGLGGHGAVEQLRAAARSGQMPAFANGGAVGRAEKRVKDLQSTYSKIDSKKANKARKLAAKDQLDAAKAELKAAKAQSKVSADAAKEAKERAGRLSESRRDLQVDLRRGTITDAFTGGSGLSQVDKLLDNSRNTDFSMSTRKRAAKDAAGLEKALASLTKRSEGLEKALEAAKSKADELRAVRDAVAGGLRDEFSLSGMLTETRRDLGSNPFTAKSISSRANQVAKRIEIFAGRLNRLRQLGYGETILQEIAALGTEDGILAAGALMNASKGERNNIIKAYNRLDSASNKAGQYVTESMYKGGLNAADGLVNGLQSKTKSVENAFYKLGKDAEKSFKKSLGIRSPSKSAEGWMGHVVDGSVLGVDRNKSKLETAMYGLGKAGEQAFDMQPAALTVPPSYEVARYATAQTGPGIDYERLATAVVAAAANSVPIDDKLQVDGRTFAKIMSNVNQNYVKRY